MAAEKSYLKYEPTHVGGLIGSTAALSVACTTLPGNKATVAIVPGLESVHVWNLRSSSLLQRLAPEGQKPGSTTESSAIRVFSRGQTADVFSGYASGYVAVFRCVERARKQHWRCVLHAAGHKVDTAVLCSAMNRDGSLLCTGGQDTDIIVWDVAGEQALYRLRGHRGAVVSLELVETDSGATYLISGSADGLVKVWDLDVQQSIQTIVASDTQVTCLKIDPIASRLFVGTRDNVIKVFDLTPLQAGRTEASADPSAIDIRFHGTLPRRANKAATGMDFSAGGDWFSVTSSQTVEVYRVHSKDEVKKKLQRKKKRKRVEGAKEAAEDEDEGTEEVVQQSASEEVTALKLFRFEEKAKAIVFAPDSSASTCHLVVLFGNNTVKSFTSDLAEAENATGANQVTLTELKERFAITHAGHRGALRTCQFTADNSRLVTSAPEGVKLWSMAYRQRFSDDQLDEAYDDRLAVPPSTLTCAGSVTMSGTETVKSVALMGSELCCVGTDEGKLLLYLLPAFELTCTVSAHAGAVTALSALPDGSGFMSAGGDRRVVEWMLRMQQPTDGNHNGGVELVLLRELELNENPLVVNCSPDGRLLGVALQDHNIQLLYRDTLKPFVVLYGHKLPVTDFAFSSDGTLLVSGGMDKSVRFWGTDFGDCHRAIHAHDDYVTSVRFIPQTHFVFTSSMDGTIKEWDGDTWNLIQLVRIHQHGVWSLGSNSDGSYIASAGVDRTIRLLERSDDMIFPEEEEERMAQEAMDEEVARRATQQQLNQEGQEVGIGGRKTIATVDAAETLMEAIDNVNVELQRLEDGGKSAQNPVLRNRTPWVYLWDNIEAIRPSELRHATSALTSTHVRALLEYINSMIDENAVRNYEVAAQLLLAMVKAQPGQQSHNALVNLPQGSHAGMLLLSDIKKKIFRGLQESSASLGFSAAGMAYLQAELEKNSSAKFFDVSKVQGAKRKFSSAKLARD